MKTNIIIILVALIALAGFSSGAEIINTNTAIINFIKIKNAARVQGRLLAVARADARVGNTQFVCTWPQPIDTDEYSTAITRAAGLTITEVKRTKTNCTFTVSEAMTSDRSVDVIALTP